MIAANLAFLRKRDDLKQSQMLDLLGIEGKKWSDYERGKANPPIELLVKISDYFRVDLKDLITKNIEDVHPIGNIDDKNGEIESTPNSTPNRTPILVEEPSNVYFGGGKKITYNMPQVITVDSQGNENVVMVPVRARAGYLNGYSDPEFISHLPAYRLPGLNTGTFRLFETEGLSMYPTLHGGDLIIGSFVENLHQIRDDRVYVVVTKNEGVVVKRVLNRIEKEGKLILKSDNYKERDQYPTMVVNESDVLEVWYATGYISRQMRPPAEMYNRTIDLEARVTMIEEMLRKNGS